MDCGVNYIKMCEKAVKIQKIVKNQLKIDDYIQWFDKRFTDIRQCILNAKALDELKAFEEEFIILFSQDQLQEMVKDRLDYSRMSKEFFLLAAFSDEYGEFCSYEALWLAFVMKELYGKVWHGQEGEWKEERN